MPAIGAREELPNTVHISAMSADHDITDNLRAAEEKYPQNATIDETLSEGGELPHLHLRRIRIGPINKGNRTQRPNNTRLIKKKPVKTKPTFYY